MNAYYTSGTLEELGMRNEQDRKGPGLMELTFQVRETDSK